MGSLSDFISAHGISSSWKRVKGPASSKEWPAGTNHYSVTLKIGELGVNYDEMTVPFHMGSALTEPPTTKEVLETLALDSMGYENAKDLEDWMSEYGEEDYVRGKRTYEAVEKIAQKLNKFLGNDLYKELLWNTELE